MMVFLNRALKALSIGFALSLLLPSYSQTASDDELDLGEIHNRAALGLPMTCSEFDTMMVIYIAGAWPEVAQHGGFDPGIDPGDMTLEARRVFFGFLESLAERGHIPAMLAVANAYAEGAPGLPENDRLAYEWGLRSAKLGSVDGMLLVAVSAFFGEGTEQDRQKSYYWILIAESQALGNENASIMTANSISLKDLKEETRQFLSFEQVQEAQELAANWEVEAQEPYCLNDSRTSPH